MVPSLRARTRLAVAVSVAGLALGALPALGYAETPDPTPPPTAGRVVSWGGPTDDLEALKPPSDLVDAVAVVANRTYDDPYSLALRADGTVVGWGSARFGQDTPPADLKQVVAIDTGAGFSLALQSDGAVRAWGDDSTGQLQVPDDLGPVTAIAAGGFRGVDGAECGYALAVRKDETVARWGRADAGGPCWDYLGDALNPPEGLSDVVAVSAGERHALALKSDGTVVGWGLNGAGQATPPEGLSDVVAISAGSDHSLARKADGSVVGWGVWGESGAPAETGVKAVSAAVADVFLHDDGSLAVYRGFNGAWTPPAGNDYVAVAAGYDHGLAIQAVPRPTGPLVGSPDVQPWTDSNPAGTAEGFRYLADADGTAGAAHLYLDATNTADTAILGVYADHDGAPGKLLASGTISDAKAGAWNRAELPATEITAGTAYWLVLLNPSDSSGTIRFRDLPEGEGGPTVTSGQVCLTETTGVPTRWRTGSSFANSPASIYLS